MLKMVDGSGIIGVDMVCPLGISTPQPPNYDRVEMEGTGILVLPNSLDAPLERLELGGKTEQVQTSGKNLLEEKLSAFTITNDIAHIPLPEDHNEKQYTMLIQLKDGKKDTVGFSCGFYDKTDMPLAYKSPCLEGGKIVSSNGIVVSKKGVNHHVCFTPASEDFFDIYHVIYTEGNLTSLPYEPYTGGKPAPSPEYPQEIKSVGKWNEETQKYEVDVKITGKNLLDTYEKAEKDSEFYSVNDDGSLSQLKSDVRPYSDVPSTLFLKSGVYYFSLFNTGVTFKCYNAEADEVFAEIKEPKSILVNLRKDANIKYKVFSNGGSSKNVRVMVSKTKASEYEPYTEQTLTLTSDRPITKWDKLVEQGGEIGWLYGSVIATIDETADLSLYAPNGFYIHVKNIDKKEKTGYCDKLYTKKMSNGEPFVLFGLANNNFLYTLNTQEFYGKTSSEIKEKLKEYPLNIIGKSETEFIPLPQSEQNAIRALKTYYPTTVITVDGGELDPDIKVTYRKEI